MKITKQKLKQLIREEIGGLTGQAGSGDISMGVSHDPQCDFQDVRDAINQLDANGDVLHSLLISVGQRDQLYDGSCKDNAATLRLLRDGLTRVLGVLKQYDEFI
jgi:hypothetical protein